MQKTIYTSADLRKAIIDLFSSPTGPRVAVSAFVGTGAETYLPSPDGLQLYCWPKAGGTNPSALRRLIKAGVNVFFADSLHMKLYWAKERGCILTSANLSTNALGAGNLKEIGTSLPSDAVDMDRIIGSLKARPLTQKELSKLEREHRLYYAMNLLKDNQKVVSFEDWFTSPFRSEWKCVWHQEYSQACSLQAKALAQAEYNLEEPDLYLHVGDISEYNLGDWILTFRLGKSAANRANWYFADRIFSVPVTDNEAYDPGDPFEIVQLWPAYRYPPPPFKIDKRFRKAIQSCPGFWSRIDQATGSRESPG